MPHLSSGQDHPQPSSGGTNRPHQVISSLFTSNPKLAQPHAKPLPKATSKPSNAPLDSSTFSGLGLSPLLVAHLESKMNILKPTSIQRAVLPALLTPSFPSDSESTTQALRDVFIQSQTGSGKTLSFLLPIIQDLLPLSSLSWIDRSVGTLAIIIAPTRELAKQISDVLETLLKMRLRSSESNPNDDDNDGDQGQDTVSTTPRMTRWLVSGLLTGGSTRTHEKARLRKGLPILVSTPGRLLDHLQHTSSFNVGKCRWLVLDEADRLMELGFEETITGILRALEGRRGLAVQAVKEGKSTEVVGMGGWNWEERRRTILCSATIREDVRKLAGVALVDPLVIKATESDSPTLANPSASSDLVPGTSTEKFTPPSQLSQKFVVVPLKLRLVALLALLRSLISQAQSQSQLRAGRGCKVIVFLSCTDSVDFHWKLFGGAGMGGDAEGDDAGAQSKGEVGEEGEGDPKEEEEVGEKVEVKSPLLPDTSIFRLHGSLPLQIRLASLRAFSSVPSSKPSKSNPKVTPTSACSILLCTSVASRGLDLPLVRAVIQYDLPTEGGATEYVHRVGRTARVGKGGEAWSFVGPSEEGWVPWVEGRMRGEAGGMGNAPAEKADGEGKEIKIEGVDVEKVLREGFGGKGKEYEERATEVQLAFERWVLKGKENAELARKAFTSHMRAYATHPSDEKHIFHIRHLHLGHLAKSFALRDAPSNFSGNHNNKGKKLPSGTKSKSHLSQSKSQFSSKVKAGLRTRKKVRDDSDDSGDPEAERRMKAAVRSQGRLLKKGGVMMSSGTDEFQIAGGSALEKLVNGR
ncbi:hypothetical protein JAAARDRAFT_130822 [Jaapia argillacea MUCL 33604]|uniref:ATP-dependent RNA helicase n=1 Tax=Jaapia argillacea MUCL 33604 TaxID=933084 RepID=A0A067PSI7_9AGAM|nr:hypothetical protein JAAARDRAFT_130822 [Jaapia argillacea MUCL 33604]